MGDWAGACDHMDRGVCASCQEIDARNERPAGFDGKCGKCGYDLGQTIAAAMGERMYGEKRPADMCKAGEHDAGVLSALGLPHE